MNKFFSLPLLIRIHPLFGFVIFISIWSGLFIEVATLFVLVLIHELGHMAAAQSYGWRVKKIVLFPFGGVAEVDEWGNKPAREEMIVALAGPFHHIWMCLFSFFFYRMGFWSEDWMEYFVKGNVMIAGFNLLPIYPLDGGKVLHALLSYRIPYQKSLLWTFGLGSFFSALLALAALGWGEWGFNLHLLGIALYLFMNNFMALKRKEWPYLRFLIERIRKGVPSSASIQPDRIPGHVPIQQVVKRLYKERYHVWEVMDSSGRVIGLLPEEKLIQQYFRNHSGITVAELVGR